MKLLASALIGGAILGYLVIWLQRRPSGEDKLTGLPNRHALERRYRRERRAAIHQRMRIGLIYIDLDEFKAINLRHGRATGDAAMRLVAQRFNRGLRPNEFLGRLGSDEFVLIVQDASSLARLNERVQAIREFADAPMVIEGRVVYVGFSCGVALSDRGGALLQPLLALATIDMDESKRGKQRRLAGAVALA